MMAVANKYYPVGSGALAISFQLGGGLEAWRGYFLSVRPAAQRLLLNVQVKHAAAFRPGPVPELMRLFANRPDWKTYITTQEGATSLHGFIAGARVKTKHLPVKKNEKGQVIPRIKKIWGLATPVDGKAKSYKKGSDPLSQNTPQVPYLGAGPRDVKFHYRPMQGTSRAKGPEPSTYVTVAQFFKSIYNIDCQPSFPVVNVGNATHPFYIPAEVYDVLPGCPASLDLAPDQTDSMIRFAVRRPHENASSIASESKRAMLNDPNILMQNFGLGLAAQLSKVPGRVLDGPNVRYQANSIANTKSGNWNMANNNFYRGARLQRWGVVLLS